MGPNVYQSLREGGRFASFKVLARQIAFRKGTEK